MHPFTSCLKFGRFKTSKWSKWLDLLACVTYVCNYLIIFRGVSITFHHSDVSSKVTTKRDPSAACCDTLASIKRDGGILQPALGIRYYMVLPEACVNLVLIQQRCKLDQGKKWDSTVSGIPSALCHNEKHGRLTLYALLVLLSKTSLRDHPVAVFLKWIFGFTFICSYVIASYPSYVSSYPSYLRALRFPQPVFFDLEDRKGEEWLQREVQESPTTTGGAEASVGVPGLNQINPRYLGVHFEDHRISEFEGWYLIRF